MKYILINGSPKITATTSNSILEFYENFITAESTIERLRWKENEIPRDDFLKLWDADIIVLVFPLYVDTVPSHLLRCMLQLEDHVKKIPFKNQVKIFTLINNGYYDARENVLGLEIIRNWTEHLGATFGGGVAIGAGALMHSMKGTVLEKHLLGPVILEIKKLYEQSLEENPNGKIVMTTPNISRNFYKFVAEVNWIVQCRRNKLSPRRIHGLPKELSK